MDVECTFSFSRSAMPTRIASVALDLASPALKTGQGRPAASAGWSLHEHSANTRSAVSSGISLGTVSIDGDALNR